MRKKSKHEWLIVLYWLRALREAPLEALEETILLMPFADDYKKSLANLK